MPTHIYGPFRPGSYLIKVREYTDVDMTNFAIRTKYRSNIKEFQRQINGVFISIYGRPLPIREENITDIILRLKTIQEETDKPVNLIASELRMYLGGCSFFKDNQQKVPIKSAAIMQAYRLMKQGQSPEQVKQSLYT
jgi:hypothetical protein